MSVAGGLYKAFDNAKRMGAECIQIFGASPRQWQARIPSKEDIKTYKEEEERSKISPVYLHSAYLVNLASPSKEIRGKSIKNLSLHLKIADLIGAQGLIFHVGSGKETSREEAIKKVIFGMKTVLKNVPGRVKLLMENSAGGGSKLGANISDFGELLKGAGSQRVKICFDTAHAYEAGIIKEYTKKNVKNLFDEWECQVGVENIIVLHANDSKTKYNSHSDRHENIGEGFIGIDGFKALAGEKRIKDKAWIIETPGFDNEGPDKKNIDILKSLFK